MTQNTEASPTPTAPDSPLASIVQRFDDPDSDVDWFALSSALREGRPQFPTDPRDQAELVGFEVRSSDDEAGSVWGTRFGPMMFSPVEAGGFSEYPDRKYVTNEAIDYWYRRATESRNAMIRARYADLAWDLAKLTGKRPVVGAAHMLIDAIVESAPLFTGEMLREAHGQLHRALDVAIRIGDQSRTSNVVRAILDFESRTETDDEMLGMWGFAFDELLDKNTPRITPEQEQCIVTDLEARLLRASNNPQDLHFITEHAALRLARYYQRLDRRTDLERVLNAFGTATVTAAEAASPLVGMAWLTQLHGVLRQFGLGAMASALDPLLHTLGQATVAALYPVSANVSLPDERVNAYLDEMCAGGMATVLARVAQHFVLDRAVVEKDLRALAKRFPLQDMVSHTIISDRGTVVCRLGSTEHDIEGRTAHHMTQTLSINSFFLRAIFERLHSDGRLTTDGLMDYVIASPAFQIQQRTKLRKGIEAFVGGDCVVALHLLVPVIEDAFRELVRLQGGQIYKPGKYGGFEELGLGPLLGSSAIADVFGEHPGFYFNVLLTDPRGINLRNRVAHGLLTDAACTLLLADRAMHVILVLAQCRFEHAAGASADSEDIPPTETVSRT